MPLNRFQLMTCLVLSLANLGFSNAHASPDVQLNLESFIDPLCNGTPSALVEVAPQECIIYKVTLSNQGNSRAHQLSIHAPIPTHTRLYKSPDVDSLPKHITYRQHQQALEIQVATLDPKQAALEFYYTVKLD